METKMSKRTKIIILLAGFFVCVLLSGMVAQLVNPSLSGKQTGVDWAGNPIIQNGFTFNPFKLLVYGLTTSDGLMFTAVMAGVILLIFMFAVFAQDGKDRDDERGFRFSLFGTYGTSDWMSMKELKEIMEVKSVKETKGTILGIYPNTDKVVSLPVNAKINKHTAIYGASGTGKSRCFVRPQILQCVAREESVIITDPKGEIYADTAEFMRKQGYDVKMFNLVDPQYSDSWNCLAEISSNPDNVELMAQTFVEVIVKNTSGAKPDHFWDNAEANLLKALALYIALDDTRTDTQKTIGAAYEMLTNNDDKKLNAMFDKLPLGHPARQPYSIYKKAGDTVRGNVIIGLGARLQVFQSEIIRRITTYSEIDLEGPAIRKSAYFVIMSDQDSTLDFLSSLFFSFLFIRLVRYADVKGTNGACDVPVNFILDEFPNIGSIPDFTKKLSTIRSRDLRVAVIFQNIAQLQNRYPDGLWEEIIGNCDTQLFLGCTDQTTAKFISERTGEITIEVNSDQLVKKSIAMVQNIPEYRSTSSVGKRFLLTPDEVMRLPNTECLVILRGQKPAKFKKFDYSKHPGADNFEHAYIRDYVPQWRAGISTNSVFLSDDDDDEEELDTDRKDTVEDVAKKVYLDGDKKKKTPPPSRPTGGTSPLSGGTPKPQRQRKPVRNIEFSEAMDKPDVGIIPAPVPVTSTSPSARPHRTRRPVSLADAVPAADPVEIPEQRPKPRTMVNQYRAGTVISDADFMDIMMEASQNEPAITSPEKTVRKGPVMIAQPVTVSDDSIQTVISLDGTQKQQKRINREALSQNVIDDMF